MRLLTLLKYSLSTFTWAKEIDKRLYHMRGSYYFRAQGLTPYQPFPHFTQIFTLLYFIQNKAILDDFIKIYQT